MRKNLSEKQWAQLIAEFEQGDESLTSFCSKNKVTKSSYHYWKKKFKLKSPKLSEQNFINISDKNKNQITLKLNDGEITFSELPDPSWAARFIKEVQNGSSSSL